MIEALNDGTLITLGAREGISTAELDTCKFCEQCIWWTSKLAWVVHRARVQLPPVWVHSYAATLLASTNLMGHTEKPKMIATDQFTRHPTDVIAQSRM